MKDSVGNVTGENKPLDNIGSSHVIWKQPALIITVLFLGVLISCLLLYMSAYPVAFMRGSWRSDDNSFLLGSGRWTGDIDLERVLQNASTPDRTVILTTSNQAWAEPNSIIDLFLKSFKIGNGTQRLVHNLVIVCLDEMTHARCLAVHPHCYWLKGEDQIRSSNEAYYMTPVYLEMMWRRIAILTAVLEMGYNFVFTDADIMWLQDPFPHFYPDADFQIACDHYYGNPDDPHNKANGGFTYVKSNSRTILFYKYWYFSRKKYPGRHDQDVFNKIRRKHFIKDIGLRIKFLDTTYFGGFCEPSKKFDLVCTMHANCCFGLKNKVHDLKLVLEDWTKFYSLSSSKRASSSFTWRAPQNCSLAEYLPPDPTRK